MKFDYLHVLIAVRENKILVITLAFDGG